MNWLGDIHEVARILGLKKKGSEYKGPCPECGGNDRFHIQKGRTHPIVMHCRHGCTFATLAKRMRDAGVVSNDEYDREEYRQRKADEELAARRWSLKVYEANIAAGYKMDYKERLNYHNLKKYIEGVDKDLNTL